MLKRRRRRRFRGGEENFVISILTVSHCPNLCLRGYLPHVYTYRSSFVRYFTKYKLIFVSCLDSHQSATVDKGLNQIKTCIKCNGIYSCNLWHLYSVHKSFLSDLSTFRNPEGRTWSWFEIAKESPLPSYQQEPTKIEVFLSIFS